MTAPCFHTALRVEKVGAHDWRLLSDLVFESAKLRGVLVVPAGTVVDFASTPRLLWTLIPKSGQYDYGATLHDAGYKGELRTASGQRVRLIRSLCDELMDEGSEAAGVGKVTRALMLAGVRAFGGGAYRGVPSITSE